MLQYEFLDIVLNIVFLAMVGLVLFPFLFMLWSIWTTWQENSPRARRRIREKVEATNGSESA